MTTAAAAKRALRALADPERAAFQQRFFRTEPGGYAEGDVFLGLTMPQVREVARAHRDLELPEVGKLLASRFHEDRVLALVVLVERAKRADVEQRDALAKFYLDHLDGIDNWDLVDISAPHVLGPYFLGRSRAPLRRLARSADLWRRRVAVLTTFHFIRQGDFEETLWLCRALLGDEHDLIHKATGWMLREVGNRDARALREFLDAHAPIMPRTMLRYAIEKLPAPVRAKYMSARPPPEGGSWGVVEDERAVESYFAKLPLPVRALARALDAIVREELPGARIGIKWSVPFYALNFPVCYISAAKSHVTFGLIRGDALRDASGLLTGTTKSPIRKATLKPSDGLPDADVRRWLRQARKLDAKGA